MRKITPRYELVQVSSEVMNGEVCPLGFPAQSVLSVRRNRSYIEGISRGNPGRLHVMGVNGPEVDWPPEIEFSYQKREAGVPFPYRDNVARNEASYIMGSRGGKILLDSRAAKGKFTGSLDGAACPQKILGICGR